jgi:hypothetical protein
LDHSVYLHYTEEASHFSQKVTQYLHQQYHIGGSSIAVFKFGRNHPVQTHFASIRLPTYGASQKLVEERKREFFHPIMNDLKFISELEHLDKVTNSGIRGAHVYKEAETCCFDSR